MLYMLCVMCYMCYLSHIYAIAYLFCSHCITVSLIVSLHTHTHTHTHTHSFLTGLTFSYTTQHTHTYIHTHTYTHTYTHTHTPQYNTIQATDPQNAFCTWIRVYTPFWIVNNTASLWKVKHYSANQSLTLYRRLDSHISYDV